MNVGDLVLEARHDGQGAPPRAATRALQVRFKIRQVTLRLESEDRPGDGRC
jgi:hypothetical protein